MDTLEKPKSLEQDLFVRQLLLQSIAQSFPDPIFVIDRYGKFLNVVGGKERSPYHGGKFLIGKYLNDVLPEDMADQFMLTISESIEKNSLQTIEYLLGSEDIVGSPSDNPKGRQWFEARISPLRGYNNATNSVIWLPINITQRKNLEEQVTDLSETDPLTGAFNRRYFLQVFENEFAISKRYNNRLSVLHLAIDKLKEINDTYGDAGGDAVLKRFAILCKSTLRDSDLFARYGGAGFIAMLPGTPSLGAAIISERIRAIAEGLQVTYEQETIQFAISIGISQILESDKNSNALLTRADSAIYQAKAKGRNRIEII
jgi:diguanylate cyclase (GGDEF)-like protein/PAS domain S-box-containing protein